MVNRAFADSLNPPLGSAVWSAWRRFAIKRCSWRFRQQAAANLPLKSRKNLLGSPALALAGRA